MSRALKLPAALGIAAAAILLPASAASAHVGIDIAEAEADGFAFATFRVPHGCEGSPTTKVKIQIPDGVVSVKPEAVAGWKLEILNGPITPYDSHGTMISEGVKEVTWTGGPLADAHVAQFGMSMKMPNKAGETVYFKTIQTCEQGETAWIEIPAEGAEEPEHPAPSLELISAGDETIADEPAEDEGEGEAAAQPGAVDDDDDTDPLTFVALASGLLGIVIGALAFRRRP
jgi:periplasmic copper chaperone A